MDPVDQLLCATRSSCRTCHWWSDAAGCRLEAMLEGAARPGAPAWAPATQARIPLVLA